jgi:uracil-DNA glycosylase
MEYNLEVKFKPFVGSNFINNDFKILLLGESHYGIDEKDQKTINVAERFLDGCNYKFLSGALKTIYGDQYKRDDIQNVAFYNYIQHMLPNGRTNPTDEEWNNSIKPFFNVLEVLEPNVILCLGKRLYSHLPFDTNDKNRNWSEEITNEKHLWCKKYKYTINEKEILLLAILHPSSVGFNGLKYNELLKHHICAMQV